MFFHTVNTEKSNAWIIVFMKTLLRYNDAKKRKPIIKVFSICFLVTLNLYPNNFEITNIKIPAVVNLIADIYMGEISEIAILLNIYVEPQTT